MDGSYVIQGMEHPYRRGYLYFNNPLLFTVQSPSPEGPYAPVDTTPRPQLQKDVFKNLPVIGSAHGQRKYETYDPARHGTYTLRDIGIIQNLDPFDFGCVKASPRDRKRLSDCGLR